MRKFKACYAKQYKDSQGQDKTSWKTLGFANEVTSQEGKVTIHLSLDAIPTGLWDGEVKLFLQDEENNQSGQNNAQSYQQPQVQYQDNSGNQQSQQQYNQNMQNQNQR